MKKDNLHVLVDLRSLFGVLSIVFVKEPFLWHAGLVTYIQWDALCFAGQKHCPVNKWAALSSLFNCFYKWTPLTLMFSSRFSRWKLISRLVNTLESDSKRHAVRSALPAVLPGPSLDLLFVLIEFICLPLASASLFFVCGLERRLCSENHSPKQTAGFFNLLSSVLLTGCLHPVCFESLFSVCRSWWWAVYLALCGGSNDSWIYGTFRRSATLPLISPCSSKEHLFSKAKTNILLPGSLWYHMLCLWPDLVLCGSWDGTLDGQHTVIKEV